MERINNVIEISHQDYLKINTLNADRFPGKEKAWKDFIYFIIGDIRMRIIKLKGLEFASAYTFSENGYSEDPTDKKFLVYSFEKMEACRLASLF